MLREEMFSKLDKNTQNLNPLSKILLLTHDDLDGCGAAILLQYFFKNVEVITCTNGKMDKEIKDACELEDYYTKYNYPQKNDYIFITDISCKEDTAEYIKTHPNVANKVILVDHHITADYLNKYNFCFIGGDNPEDGFSNKYYKDKNTNGHASGTTLLLDFLYYKGIPDRIYPNIDNFAFNVGSYDTWDWVKIFNKEDKSPNNLNKLYSIYSIEFKNKILKQLKDNISDFEFDKTDDLLLDIDKIACDKYIERKAKGFREKVLNIDNQDYKVCIGIGEQYLEELFNKMEEDYPLADFYAINTGYSISLRSRENALNRDPVDVSKIAKSLGGGGHKEAAGFKIDNDMIDNFYEHIFTNTEIEPVKITYDKNLYIK